jgi:hypothetical protein
MSRYDFILAKPSAVRHLRACFHQFKSFITTSEILLILSPSTRTIASMDQVSRNCPACGNPLPLFKDLRPASAKGAPMSMN